MCAARRLAAPEGPGGKLLRSVDTSCAFSHPHFGLTATKSRIELARSEARAWANFDYESNWQPKNRGIWKIAQALDRVLFSDTDLNAAVDSGGATHDEMGIERGFNSPGKLSVEHLLNDGECHFPQLLARDVNGSKRRDNEFC